MERKKKENLTVLIGKYLQQSKKEREERKELIIVEHDRKKIMLVD